MFERIALPYDYAALEPHIDAETVHTHYDKHHKAYTDKFNDLIQGIDAFKNKTALEILLSLDKAPKDKQAAIRNNGGGYYNHNLYFESLTPKSGKPGGRLAEMIDKDFGGYDTMLEKLDAAATAELFGSGWAWLTAKNGKLEIVISHNQDLPADAAERTLLLPLDMWEHAYYLKYKNDKKQYVKNFFAIISWDKVAERLEKAK